MTQNDQAAMNEQLTQLRLQGLSIDGDNRYKQELIDAIIGAMMFGAQGANPPPASHWLEQFYVIAREEREALARVEAEHEANRLELGEALILIGQVLDCRTLEDLNPVRRYLNEFVDRYSLRPVPDVDLVQAEQQEAELWHCKSCRIESGGDGECPACDNVFEVGELPPKEAQGAQAGDERAAFEEWLNEIGLSTKRDSSGAYLPHEQGLWDAWETRAALATQPAVRGAEQ